MTGEQSTNAYIYAFSSWSTVNFKQGKPKLVLLLPIIGIILIAICRVRFYTCVGQSLSTEKQLYLCLKKININERFKDLVCSLEARRLGVRLTVIKPKNEANYLSLWTSRQFNFEPCWTLSNVHLFCFYEILSQNAYPVRLNPSSVVTVDDIHEAEGTRQVVEDKFTHYVTFSNSRAVNYHNTLLKRQWNSSVEKGI